MSQQNLMNPNSPTVPLAVTAASANVALPQKTGMLLVSNIGAAAAWYCTGVTAPTAVASTGNNACIPPGMTQFVRISPLDGFLAAISGTTTTLSISCVSGGVTS